MKIRQGFVSNSSSSSFVISTSKVTPIQVAMILNYQDVVRSMLDYFNEFDLFADERPKWNICEEDGQVKGSTFMDNFEMDRFLSLIGVPEDCIHWSD